MKEQKIYPSKPIAIGDKVKVYITDSPRTPLQEQTFTFGEIASLEKINSKMLIKYLDCSNLPLTSFRKFIDLTDVHWVGSGEYIIFNRIGQSKRKL